MAKTPVAPEGAPPPVFVLTQTSRDMPALREKRERVAKKEAFLRQQANKAATELADLDAQVARREAHADAALAALKAADQQHEQHEQQQQQRDQKHDKKAVGPSQAPRVTSATRSSHRSRSPLAPGLVRPEEKTKKLAIWPTGAKKR